MSATLRQRLHRTLAALFVLAPPAATARPVQVWTLEGLAKRAYALATAEVHSTRKVKAIGRNQTRWRIDLFEMEAKLRVLRVFPQDQTPALRPRQIVSLRYRAIDWQKTEAIVNGPTFPELRVGDVFVFPLSVRRGGADAPWELIDEEDNGLLVPASRGGLKGAPAKTAARFVLAELVGAFAQGSYGTIFQGARFLGYHREPAKLEELVQLVERHVGKDEERWLDIATAAYCAMPLQRPTIADLLRASTRRSPRGILAARALSHLRPGGRADRLIANAVKRASCHCWGTAIAVKKNAPRHPMALRLLAEALDRDAPAAIYVARSLVDGRNHPLAAKAVAAAARLLSRRKRVTRGNFGPFRAACELLRDYGDEGAFAILLDELEAAQKADRPRYKMLWQACAYCDSPRLLPICRIVLDDRAAFAADRRFCDLAAAEVQRHTGVPFAFSLGLTLAERDEAIGRIRAWLDEQLPRRR